ncbi:AAA family ATPase [Actinomyces massiliensis]|uniref:Putative nicotinamide-nucleotide adenylyltransferase n=1 Tax=Actinomyces massiliensis F0489 TaxID=1125718 RepID=J1GVC8_9ACTO|nr:AAA family ATPase [Actinomyces massiliensis]EJF36848.1 putative nicotinamide-nucleotide adenylyltransferase [Actinomyces massiliensis F0489]WLD73013.1 AAA family ATPase [Actinomyces massiliensis]
MSAQPAAVPAPRYRHGLVIGKFYPPHAGHLSLIRQALACCERVTVEVLASSAESVSGELRADWLRVCLPSARVVTGVDDEPVDYASPTAWQAHTAVMLSLLDPADGPVDAVATSDSYGAELASRLGASWLQVDPGRQALPVSGRRIRSDPARYWWALPAPVRAWFVRRVAVVGAESTGTTTLARALSDHYRLPQVPEFGRQWSRQRPGGLDAAWASVEFDLVARVQAQWEDEAAALTARPLLITDTDVLATSLWHERYMGSRSASVEALAASRRPDLYLLTGDEIPFVQDGLRDGEHIRHDMQESFRRTLAAGPVPWVELQGSHEERMAEAIALIDELAAEPRPMSPPLSEAHVGASTMSDGLRVGAEREKTAAGPHDDVLTDALEEC